MAKSGPDCPFTHKRHIWRNFIQYFWYSYNVSSSCKKEKILRVDPKNKAIKFLGPNWGKNDPFWNYKSFFFKDWAPWLFSKHNDVIVCKILKLSKGVSWEKLFTDLSKILNNFGFFIGGPAHRQIIWGPYCLV